MKKIQLKAKAISKIKTGYPLIQEQDLQHLADKDLNDWVELLDSHQKYIATGYISKQNKGIGWVVTYNKKQKIDRAFFFHLFNEAKAKRQHLANDSLTTCYRLFNGEGDNLGGVTVDLYAEYVVFSWYNEVLYQNQHLIYDAFQAAYPEIKGGYSKLRFKLETEISNSSHVFGEKASEPLIVLENGIKYATYLNEGLMTGIFLDQRIVRNQLCLQYSVGKRVLNTFSYTGAFSVASAYGGAVQTTSVDLAKRSLEKTKEQFAINQLDLTHNKIVVMDVFDYFKYAKRKGLTFDVIILDPPSFARNKKRHFSVVTDYGELVSEVLPLFEQTGTLVASCNTANLTIEKYQEMVFSAITQAGFSFELLETHQLPEDFTVNARFPEGNYLKVFIIKVTRN